MFQELLLEAEAEREQALVNQKHELAILESTVNDAIMMITSEQEYYNKYLELQAQNPELSINCIALVMTAMPDATLVRTKEQWLERHRSINTGEVGISVLELARYTDSESGRFRNGYFVQELYDYSQTQGRELITNPILTGDSSEIRVALKSIIGISPVPINTNPELSQSALYNEVKRQIEVNPSSSTTEVFASLCAETVHAIIHSASSLYERSSVDIDAQSISYMLCSRFHIPSDKPDASNIHEIYEGADLKARRDYLNFLKNTNERIGNRIISDITQNRSNAN